MKSFLAMLLMTLVVGCSSVPEAPRVVFLPVPKELITQCTASRPPEIDFYTFASFRTKERLLVEYIFSLQQEIVICNKNMERIQQWSDEMSKRFPAD